MIDGLNPEDPGWRALVRQLERVAPPSCLWLYSGEPPRPRGELLRAISDLRERSEASVPTVDPAVLDAPDPIGARRFAAAAMWPRAHLGKDFTLAAMARAAMHLEDEGALYLVARKQKGGKSLAAAMDRLFGDVEVVARDKGYHLYRSARTKGLDETLAQSWLSQRYPISDPRLDGLELEAAPGVFSRRGLDRGTAALIDAAREQIEVAPSRVLDLCCGVGPLGLWAAARWPDARVDLVDSHLIAVGLARHNAARLGLEGRAQVHAHDGLDPALFERHYDLALINPPTHAPPEALQALVAPLARVLAPQGRALFVVNRAGRILEALEAAGLRAQTLARGDYAIISARAGGDD